MSGRLPATPPQIRPQDFVLLPSATAGLFSWPQYGPGINNVDFAAHRFFAIPARECMKLEFRGELFNLFNRTQLAMPETSLGLPQTGQITATSAPNRQIQFALKLQW